MNKGKFMVSVSWIYFRDDALTEEELLKKV